MLFTRNRVFAAITTVCALAFGQTVSAQQPGTFNLRVIGLTTDQRLVSFNTISPRFTTRNIGFVTGLDIDTAMVGIDFRPLAGPNTLYGVGNAGGVYTLDTLTGTATFVARHAVRRRLQPGGGSSSHR